VPSEIAPKKIQKAVWDGHKRLANFRSARVMFLRQYCGQYYDTASGNLGNEPFNLIFNAIRVLVPNLVFNFPKHNVSTRFIQSRQYAEMLGLALDQQNKQLKMRDIYRRAIVDAIFVMGILKTGICDSGTAIGFEPDDHIDPGTVYTENVDFDNFVFDPNARDLDDALFIGDKIKVPRSMLLDSGLYRNDLIMRLPRWGSEYSTNVDRSDKMSSRQIDNMDTGDLEDQVEIYELWVPRAKAIVSIPAAENLTFDDYLRVHDYYGPDSGPYTYLKLSPPVPNNPMPISLVGIWHDLHQMANRMVKKVMDQADRQKSIVGYRRSAADDAQAALEASDGEAIAMDDPQGVQTYNFGGQAQSNEVHIQQLQSWFNMMSGNTEALSGQSMSAKSATEANILQGNSAISLEDMKDLAYNFVAEEASKRAWFLHTDPLIEVPLIRRVHTPAQFQIGPAGPMMTQPAQQQEVQVFLTPEARCGDFLDFTFEIQPDSMGRVDSAKRLATALDFAIKVLPAAAQAAQTCAMMGVPFSFPRFVVKLGKDAGLDWMDEVFMDPEFQQQMMLIAMRGPQEGQSKGNMAPPNMAAGIAQNGQPGNVAGGVTPPPTAPQMAQQGANTGQAALPVRSGY
jgi:hypothetical protein